MQTIPKLFLDDPWVFHGGSTLKPWIIHGVPLIDAAQWGMTGTLMVLRPGHTACLQCVYPEPPPFEELFPVVGAISSAVGSFAALEAIKILSGCGEPMWGRLMNYDGFRGRTFEVTLAQR